MRVGRKGEEEEEREGTRSIAMTLLLLLSVFSLRLSRAKFYYGFTVDCDSVRLFCGSIFARVELVAQGRPALGTAIRFLTDNGV